MKIGIVGEVSHRAILEHTQDCVRGITDEVDGVLVENVFDDVPDGIPVINTCNGVKVIEADKTYRAAFYEQIELADGLPSSFLYGFLSPTSESDWMEFVVSDRFMDGGVGPRCGFVQGCGLPVSEEVHEAFPKLALLIDMLHQLQYCGEVCIGVTKDFQICTVSFGHTVGAFALYTELAQQSPQRTLEFCFGKHDTAKLHSDRIAIATLMSYPPYPSGDAPFSILAPRQAERHMYRFQSGNAELAYAAANGTKLFEARRRIRRTLQNCRGYQDNLQHRTDGGKYCNFVISQDQYKAMGGYS